MFGLFKKKTKKLQPIIIYGEYSGSHPDFPNSVLHASLKCDENGVDLNFNKGAWEVAKRFEYSEIEGFNFDFGSDSTLKDSRVSTARVVTFGVAGAMAKKKTYEDSFFVHNILYTKNGNIELLLERTNKVTSDISKTAANLELLSCQRNSAKFKKFVLDKLSPEVVK